MRTKCGSLCVHPQFLAQRFCLTSTLRSSSNHRLRLKIRVIYKLEQTYRDILVRIINQSVFNNSKIARGRISNLVRVRQSIAKDTTQYYLVYGCVLITKISLITRVLRLIVSLNRTAYLAIDILVEHWLWNTGGMYLRRSAVSALT